MRFMILWELDKRKIFFSEMERRHWKHSIHDFAPFFRMIFVFVCTGGRCAEGMCSLVFTEKREQFSQYLEYASELTFCFCDDMLAHILFHDTDVRNDIVNVLWYRRITRKCIRGIPIYQCIVISRPRTASAAPPECATSHGRTYLAPTARKSVFLEAGVPLVGLHGMPSFMHVHNNGMMR
jgi:hypothetical protein